MLKLKVVTNEENYKEVALKRAIIMCWALLIICFIIKIFGGNFFNIISNNERFIQLCKFIDNTWIYYVVGYINYIFAGYIYTFAIVGKTKFEKQTYIIILIILTLCYLSKSISLYFGMIIDYCFYILIFCCILCVKNNMTLKKSILRTLVGLLLINLFQVISIFVKNIGIFVIINNNSLIQIIFNIDYFIMLLLYMFYSIRKN